MMVVSLLMIQGHSLSSGNVAIYAAEMFLFVLFLLLLLPLNKTTLNIRANGTLTYVNIIYISNHGSKFFCFRFVCSSVTIFAAPGTTLHSPAEGRI